MVSAAGSKSPTIDNALWPVGTTTGLIIKPKLPTAEVELTPVKEAIVSGVAVIDPTLDVALWPVSWSNFLNESP